MKVILAQDVENLGKIGEVIQVKEGFARNFLIPRKKAYIATDQNLKKIEQEKAKRQVEAEKMQLAAQEFANKMSGVSVTINVEVNDIDKLYGAVSEIDIVKALKEEGFDIDKKQILLEKPIEELGIFEVEVLVHPGVIAKIRVWVTKK
jgi:large subunit ribosomal protein L9